MMCVINSKAIIVLMNTEQLTIAIVENFPYNDVLYNETTYYQNNNSFACIYICSKTSMQNALI